MATWNNETKHTGLSWNYETKHKIEISLKQGVPMGILLAWTYAADKSVSSWDKDTKHTTSWNYETKH